MPFDFRANLIAPTDSILATLGIIDSHGVPVGLVHEAGRLIGIVTDGDIRRGLLRGVSLNAPVAEVMNRAPITRAAGISDAEAARVMAQHRILQLPLLDSTGRIVALKLLADIAAPRAADEGEGAEPPRAARDNPVLIMAGGRGTRFRPLIVDEPKPMLEVGGKPILATIIERLVRQGFTRLYLAVNYKRELIEAHFGDGRDFGAAIAYLREPEAMGTAGALALLPAGLTKPLIVMNGDVLTKINLHQLLDFHAEAGAAATMAVREYAFTVPYGVVKVEGQHLAEIEEKPEQKFLVNAGIYVLEPRALDLVAPGAALDMPELFQRIKGRYGPPAVFPMREYWIDVGRAADLIRAHREFGAEFLDD